MLTDIVMFFSCRVQAGIWQQGKLKRDTGQRKIEFYKESKNWQGELITYSWILRIECKLK